MQNVVTQVLGQSHFFSLSPEILYCKIIKHNSLASDAFGRTNVLKDLIYLYHCPLVVIIEKIFRKKIR